MSRRKWYKCLLIACLVAGALIALIHVLSRPGPDDPEWWLNRATEEAYSARDGSGGELLAGVSGLQARMGDFSSAKRTVARMKRSWLARQAWRAKRFIADLGIGSSPARLPDWSTRQPGALWYIVSSEIEAGDIDGAKATLGMIGPESAYHGQVASWIVAEQAGAGDISGAKATLGMMGSEHRSYGPAAGSIARAQATAGDISGAKATLGMTDPTLHESDRWYRWAFSEIVRAQVKAGGFAEAELLLQSIPEGKNSLFVDAVAQIAYAHAKAGDAALARSTAERLLGTQLDDENHRPIHDGIVFGLIDAGRLDEATSVAHEHCASYVHYNIAMAQLEEGDLEAAEAALRRVPAGPVPRSFLARIVSAMIKTGKGEEALALARSLGGADESRALTIVCEVKTCLGDIEGAKALANGISDPDWRARAIHEVVLAQLATGGVEEAHAMADECARTLGEDPAPETFAAEELALVYLPIAEAYAAAGDADGYSECIQAATELERVCHFTEYRLEAYISIAETQAKTGDLAGALETISTVRDQGPADVTRDLRVIGRGYAATHDNLDDLIRFIEALREPLQRGYAYVGAAEGLIQKQEEAKKQKGAQE